MGLGAPCAIAHQAGTTKRRPCLSRGRRLE